MKTMIIDTRYFVLSDRWFGGILRESSDESLQSGTQNAAFFARRYRANSTRTSFDSGSAGNQRILSQNDVGQSNQSSTKCQMPVRMHEKTRIRPPLKHTCDTSIPIWNNLLLRCCISFRKARVLQHAPNIKPILFHHPTRVTCVTSCAKNFSPLLTLPTKDSIVTQNL